jgi:small subunit ribosomal protein S7
MQKGKGAKAESLLLAALGLLSRGPLSLQKVLLTALFQVSPLLQVKPVRRGRKILRIPFPLRPSKQLSSGLSWLVQSARKKKGGSMSERLAREVQEAAKGQGASVRKRTLLHKVAKGNRAYLHFRWA